VLHRTAACCVWTVNRMRLPTFGCCMCLHSRPAALNPPPQGNLVPLYERVMADQLTPVLAYRCLVKEDDREAPSFLFESVTNGTQQVRIRKVVE